MTDLIFLGHITKAFGIKGGMAIKQVNPESCVLVAGRRVVLRQRGGVDKELFIKQMLDGNRIFFEEITDRNAAESLRGGELFVDSSALPETKDDEFYLFEVMGAKVFDVDGIFLGEIVGFSSNNAQTLLETKTKCGHVASIPLVKPIVQKIDFLNKQIIVDPPAGLLDPLN